MYCHEVRLIYVAVVFVCVCVCGVWLGAVFLCRECPRVSHRPLRGGMAPTNTLFGIFLLILTSKAPIHLDVSESPLYAKLLIYT